MDFKRFFRGETAAAIVLVASAALAVVVANSPVATAWSNLLHVSLVGLRIDRWINDGLMAIFFLLVGIEIRREMLAGELASWRARILPGLAAIGGMAVPALVFIVINRNHSLHLTGWAIPTATDIAFAVGALAILGPRAPLAARLVLVSIAIADDLLAILVIALFYATDISGVWLGAAGACTLILIAMNRRNIRHIPPYLLVGFALWLTLYRSGIHATLAGVVLAFALPATIAADAQDAPMITVEHAIDPWVNLAILPLFGLVNAGIDFSGLGPADVVGTLPLGIGLGLVVGKQVGIFGSIWLLVRLRVAPMPSQLTWGHIHAIGILCGIGFTMSLFIGGLAFDGNSELMNATRVGVLGGSVISAFVGILLMRQIIARHERHGSVDTIHTTARDVST